MTRDDLAARLLATFIDELDEQLRVLGDALLALERHPADVEQLRVVFRVMHTLKGAARAAAVAPIEELCHALEGELAATRDAGRSVTGMQLAQLFAAADVLTDAARALRAGETLSSSTFAAVIRQGGGERITADARRVEPRPPGAVAHDARADDTRVSDLRSGDMITASAPMTGATVDAPAVAAPAASTAVAAVRVGVRRLDALVAAAGELLNSAGSLGDRPRALAAIRDRLLRSPDPASRGAGRELARLTHRAEDDARAISAMAGRFVDAVRGLRVRPFGEIVEALPRVVRDVAASVDKHARLVVEGGDVEADRNVLETLREPLTHLVRNAVDHGLESPGARQRLGKPDEGTITVRAALRADRLVVTVRDDGSGVHLDAIRASLVRRGVPVPADDHDLLESLFAEGFSTRTTATAISGRGVGLGIVRTAVARLGGTVEVASTATGTTFTIDVPVSIATVRALMVAMSGHPLAIPSSFVLRSFRVRREHLRIVDGRVALPGDDGRAPTRVVQLSRILGPPFAEPPDLDPNAPRRAILLAVGARRAAFLVDDIVEELELVVRPFDQGAAAASTLVAGASVLGDGRVALLLDVHTLVTDALRDASGAGAELASVQGEPPARPRVLVVDDSITTRTLEESVLAANGYDVTTAVDGAQAWRIIEQGGMDVVVSDIEMPNMTGLELCERVRASKHSAALPFILVTSLDDEGQRNAGLEAGADAYITKSSFDQDALLDTVRQLIGRGHERT